MSIQQPDLSKSETDRLTEKMIQESRPAFQTIRNVLIRKGLPVLNDADMADAIKKAAHKMNTKDLRAVEKEIHTKMDPKNRAKTLNELEKSLEDIIDQIQNPQLQNPQQPQWIPNPGQWGPKQPDNKSASSNLLHDLVGQKFIAMFDNSKNIINESQLAVIPSSLFTGLKNIPSKTPG